MVMKQKGSLQITKNLTVDGTLDVAGIVFPVSDGTNNQVVKTDGGGTLSFTDQTGGAGGIDQLQAALTASVFAL